MPVVVPSNTNLSDLLVTAKEVTEYLSDGTATTILKVLMYGLTPVVSSLGIAGNILSIMILTKHGFKKCSNILLVCLAFADLCYLVGFNNVPKILYDTQGHGRYIYSKGVSHFLFILYFVFFLLDYGMGFVTLQIPMLITIERLFAVFMPLKFPLIITPVRTFTAVGLIAAFSLSYMTYSCFWYRFEYSYDSHINATVGIMARSELFYKHQHTIAAVNEILSSNKVQPLITLVGCVLIIVKVKFASKKRMAMTTNKTKTTSTSKTTQTLLAVSLVYTFVCVVMALPTYIPEKYMSYSFTSREPTNLSLVMYQVINIVMCMNSSWNFIIYMALNKNFRDTYSEIIGKCLCCSRLRHVPAKK